MERSKNALFISLITAMALVVVSSNILVNFPVMITLNRLELGDILTWGAFTYPAAFLITDLTNRAFGPKKARRVVVIGFFIAVICSATVPNILFNMGLFPFELSVSRITRISISSGLAFLIAQILDVSIFNILRNGRWWHAPFISSIVGSIVDTTLFFSLAFASTYVFLGENDSYALEIIPFLGLLELEAQRWLSWAIGDLTVKFLVGLVLLLPYFALHRLVLLQNPKQAIS